MNSNQEPLDYNFILNEMQDDETLQKIAREMQQNFNDIENDRDSLSNHLEHFIAVSNAIIQVEKTLNPD